MVWPYARAGLTLWRNNGIIRRSIPDGQQHRRLGSPRHAPCGAGRMSVREIPSRDWPAFLDKLAREHRAWLASVDRGGQIEARDQPLQSIAVAEDIDIRIGGKDIRVDEPQAVRVEETADGTTQSLQIDDAAGRRLTLRFRVAVASGALDGLAPGEI